MKRTRLSDKALFRAADIIWQELFGLGLEGVTHSLTATLPELSTSVQIAGAWEGAVVLSASKKIARALAGSMLGLAEPAEPEVCDAIGELTNLIAGAVQTLLPAPSELSLPSVIKGEDYKLIFPRCSMANEVHFAFCAEALSLMIFEANHERCALRAPELGCSLTDFS
jgi:CheY-specific phosphatase CheX